MSQTTKIEYQNVGYRIADIPGERVCMVFGIRKSGSSILNNMVEALASHAGLNYVDVAGKLFEAGVTVPNWQNDPGMAAILRPGNVYGGFRNFPQGLQESPMYRTARKLLLVRDPRDALVSEYFSNAFSHSLPRAGEGREMMLELRQEALRSPIEEFVLQRAPQFARTMVRYAPLLEDPSALVLKYEEYIAQKRQLLALIAGHFGWPFDDTFVSQVLSWADVLPSEERPAEFIRKVTPGDHREKLGHATIGQLNALLGTEMARFGYTTD